ncbi:MAG: HAMP domain-containing protein, partial [Lachnospiraceae bacterium]|nr:HAMP domain-containing protein [Lachnospiraceae bacterium]
AVVDVNFSNQMTLVLLIVLVLVICLIYYHLRHRQTVLSRIILIFLVVIYFSDYFVEQWMEQAFTEQIIQTQDLALSMLGENLKNRIEDNLDEDGGLFLDGIADSEFFQRTGLSVSQEYEYTVIAPDEDGLLRVSASTQEYANVPIERRYTGEALEAIMETWESGESITVSDTDAGIGRRELFMTITRDDGTICGILAIAVNGGNFQAQIWRYDNSLRIIILAMMAIVFLVLVMVIIIFMRPLKRLKACADELADGKLGVTVPVRGHDEIAVIAEAFNHMSGGISRYVTDIREMSECYYKFIPAKMLTLLGKESIRQVELGDEISENMTILSMHAIDYPKQKLALSAEKVYANINHILSLMVASIVEQQGMVEHFEDSGLTALFTEDCRRALDAAISIHRSLDQNAPGEGRCVAVTYGRVMLGVIGNKNRMELTAISAHADLAKALRTKGDRYGARILITHLIYQQIPDFEQQYHARYLGNIYLSATDTMERIYDVYDGDPEDEFYYKELTKLLFEEGVNLFVSRKFYEARLVFVEVLKQHRRDSAAREYLYRCDRYYKLSSEEQKNADTVTERF